MLCLYGLCNTCIAGVLGRVGGGSVRVLAGPGRHQSGVELLVPGPGRREPSLLLASKPCNRYSVSYKQAFKLGFKDSIRVCLRNLELHLVNLFN